ncbi:DUF58 domain-containing protein [sulfur-oxidizing endosymbiont of Gigantopelta aegis]|uniref:DUF58 domain-containing protein n=1 Tax=sulfur-oxidizing endosymbiont of Gigantopelta aegis TaxID=2794934 RepID=UPI0018DC8F6A|nr:DUF58 domain-containing protein [sulfur-oxidizing endosymbiont of Gigantopelta aegis]
MSLWNFLQSKPQNASPEESNNRTSNTRATQVDLTGLIQLRYQSSHLSLGSQRKAFSTISGNYSSAFKGRGLNFDEVRPYQPGDDIRNIDWNVTARTDKVHTKVFQEERERPVFIIVDLSSSMYFGTRHCLKSVTAAKAAALFAWAGADNSNRIGGLIFNDYEHMEMRPKGGHRGVLQFLKLLSDFHNKHDNVDPSASNSTQSNEDTPDNKQVIDGKQDFDNKQPLNKGLLFARIQKMINPGSIVLLASDFNQIDTHATNNPVLKHIQYIARHNDLLITYIFDALEKQLPPPGQYGISDGQHEQIIDTRDRHLRASFQQLSNNKSDAIEQFCVSNRIHLINLATHDKVPDQFLAALGKGSSVRRIARSRS